MESSRRDAAAQLAAAERVRETFATRLRLPAGFHVILGTATAALIASIAFGATSPGTKTGGVISFVGVAVFLGAAAYLAWRFRAVNGARVDGLFSHAICGSTRAASLAFGVPMTAATWAAIADLTWVAVLVSAVGGIAYAVCAERWWAAYRRDPVGHTDPGSSRALTVVLVLVALGGIVLVMVSSR